MIKEKQFEFVIKLLMAQKDYKTLQPIIRDQSPAGLRSNHGALKPNASGQEKKDDIKKNF